MWVSSLPPPPQVLKADLVDIPEDEETTRQAFLATIDSAVTKALMVDKLDEARPKRKTKAVAESDPRLTLVANKFFLLSLDRTLQKSIGISLDYFAVPQRKLFLGPTEELVFKDVPHDEQIVGTAPVRACARDRLGVEADRVLVPRLMRSGVLHRPTLHKAQDQGAIGWVGAVFCDNFLGLRTTTHPDTYHRIYQNDLKTALSNVGAWIIVCEHTLLFNVRTAPWQVARSID